MNSSPLGRARVILPRSSSFSCGISDGEIVAVANHSARQNKTMLPAKFPVFDQQVQDFSSAQGYGCNLSMAEWTFTNSLRRCCGALSNSHRNCWSSHEGIYHTTTVKSRKFAALCIVLAAMSEKLRSLWLAGTSGYACVQKFPQRRLDMLTR